MELNRKNREKCFFEESDKNVAVTFFIYDLTKEEDQLRETAVIPRCS